MSSIFLSTSLSACGWKESKCICGFIPPCPAWQLILSKLVVGIPFTLLSLGVSGLYPTYLMLGPIDTVREPVRPWDPTVFWCDVGLIVWRSLGFLPPESPFVGGLVRPPVASHLPGQLVMVDHRCGNPRFSLLFTQWINSHHYIFSFPMGPDTEI